MLRFITRAAAGLILLALTGGFGVAALSIGTAMIRGGGLRIPALDGTPAEIPLGNRPLALSLLGFFLIGSGILGYLASSALSATRQGPAGNEIHEVPRAGVNPSFAVLAAAGSSMKLLAIPRHYVPRQFAGRFGPGCVLAAGAWTGLHASLTIWFGVPWFAQFFLGMLSLVALAAAIPMSRTWLALQRVDLHVDEFTSPVRPNEVLRVRARVRARTRVRISGASLLLACVRIVNDRVPGSPSNWVRQYPYGHEEVVAGEATLAPGDEISLVGTFVLPASSPTSSPPSGTAEADSTCWILGVLVRIPGWPDLEISREITVSR